jgi:hypothetical protein
MGQRIHKIINHKNIMCIELQFFFMVLIISGYFNQWDLSSVSIIVDKFSQKYSYNCNFKFDFFKAIKYKSIKKIFNCKWDYII